MMARTTATTRFPLGRVLATPGAIRVVKGAGESPLRLLKRHAHGDFGDLHEDDVRANELAIRQGMRVLSAFVMPTGEHVWVLTEADRSTTTILLAEEHCIDGESRTSERSMKNKALQVANK